ncbi:DUF2975 domain-containing protein [Dethiothermospora halolimnae]|uniref:DUF2975 domain-containing protein n=1 Tax=Dethiothermospora halolimnae TaxID=3114390 RepID=UPI003CCBE09D
MNYHGKKSLSTVLKISLDVLVLVGVVLFIILSKDTIFSQEFKTTSFKKYFIYSLFIIGSLSLLSIAYNLRKILNSLIGSNPFIWNNVKRLKRISIGCFIIAGEYIINLFVNLDYENFSIIYIDERGIHTDMEFFIFLFAGAFILILSKVFKEAVIAKEENDLTI